jgi:hypothetical protein
VGVHNAVAVDGSWSTADSVGADVVPTGASTTLSVDRPGVYGYYCTLHGTPEGDGMYATLVVGDDAYTGDPDAEPRPTVATASGVTRRVPEQHATIQEAVDAADPGDLVLVGPGVYREEVKIGTPSLVLRGSDRNRVVWAHSRQPATRSATATATTAAAWRRRCTGAPGRRRVPLARPGPRCGPAARSAHRPAVSPCSGGARIRSPAARHRLLVGAVRALRVPAAIRAAGRVGGAGPVGPRPARRPVAVRDRPWVAVVLLLPFVGVVIYLGARAALPGWFRATVVGGGVAAYLVVVAIGALVGGVV